MRDDLRRFSDQEELTVGDDEDFGGGENGLETWFSRSPADIEQERSAAEQAGRDAYAEAIRTGADVQARTPAELVELGRSRLAQQGESTAQAQAPSSQEQPTSAQDCGNLRDALMQGDAFVRAGANKATFGLADHLAAAGDAVASGGNMDQIWRQYQANLQQQRARDAYDAQNRSVAHTVGNIAGDALNFVGAAKLGSSWANGLPPSAKGNLGEDLSALKTMFRGDWPVAAQQRLPVSGGETIADHVTAGGQIVESKFGPAARLTPRQTEAAQEFAPQYRVDKWGPRHVGWITGAGAAFDWPVDDPNTQ